MERRTELILPSAHLLDTRKIALFVTSALGLLHAQPTLQEKSTLNSTVFQGSQASVHLLLASHTTGLPIFIRGIPFQN
jgi:hypothetical protein